MKLEEIVGDNVREFRKRMGLSQEKFAEHAHVHRTFVGTVERAEQNISLQTVAKLARALKIDAYVLLIKDAFLQAEKYQRLK